MNPAFPHWGIYDRLRAGLSHGNSVDIGLGTQFTVNDRPDDLDRYYGDDLGYAFQFFLRIRPSLHGHGAH
jgi:hypothetical protein